MQPNNDKIRKLREWDRKDLDEKCSPDAVTEKYNGFTIEIRYLQKSEFPELPTGAIKFFIITPGNKIYTNGYFYKHGDVETYNAAYEAIDNGEVPDE